MTFYVGQVLVTAGTFVPSGWLAANGVPIAISSNEDLYSLYGNTFGGSPQGTPAMPTPTFNLPDLTSQVPKGLTPIINVNGTYPPGDPVEVPDYDLSTPILGLVTSTTAATAPSGWLECNGATVPTAQHVALFSLLGTRFGGGLTSFALPNISGGLSFTTTITKNSDGSYTTTIQKSTAGMAIISATGTYPLRP